MRECRSGHDPGCGGRDLAAMGLRSARKTAGRRAWELGVAPPPPRRVTIDLDAVRGAAADRDAAREDGGHGVRPCGSKPVGSAARL